MAKPEVVVITGASAGLGRALVRRFAQDASHIALLARGRDGLEATKREVDEAGGRALVIPVDVANWEGVDAAASQIEDTLGPIDIWINNAMTSVFSPVRAMLPEDYRRVTDVTYLGAVHGTLAALHRMLPRDRGTIVQVGTALAYRGIPLQSAYCAAKHALQGFMDSLRSELLHDGSRVRVSMVHLPAMNTPHFTWAKSRMPRRAQPVPPIYQPEIGAEAVYWAAHHDRRELWVGMTTVGAILADRVAPAVLDRYLAGNGYDSQQTEEPESPGRPDNLWEPVPGDRGAHGPFGERAITRSPQLWAATHRQATIAALLTGAAVMLGTLLGSARDVRDEAATPGGLGPEERAQLKALLDRV